MKLWNEASNGVWPGKSFTRAPRWAPNVPDRTLGGVYLLGAMIMQWYEVMIMSDGYSLALSSPTRESGGLYLAPFHLVDTGPRFTCALCLAREKRGRARDEGVKRIGPCIGGLGQSKADPMTIGPKLF
jgi:hypothetical protein